MILEKNGGRGWYWKYITFLLGARYAHLQNV